MTVLARHYTARRPEHRVNWRVGGNRRMSARRMARIFMPLEHKHA